MLRPPNTPKRKLPKPVKSAPQQDQIALLIAQGLDLHQQGKFYEAKAIYENVLAIKTNHFDALLLLGTILAQTNEFTKAVDFLTTALKINPNHAVCYSNRGNALKELKRLDEALASYNKAISIQPDYAEAYSNRGNALKELKRLDEALASYDKAIGIKPDFAEAYWNLSLCHLLGGNFKDGWQGYEWRWKRQDISKTAGVRNFSQPLWLGEQLLKGKTILLYAEQGLGDTIQFCRYVPIVSMLGAKVILEVQRPLVKLLKNLEGVNQIIAKGDTLPAFDFQCPLLSLPLAFKTKLNTIPPVSQNITSDSENLTKWQTILGEKTKLRVGLVWSSVSNFKNDDIRSMTLLELFSGLPKEGFEYICLQKDIKEIDKYTLKENPQIKFFGDLLNDFSDTAGLIDCLDLVITTCTSVPHLSCSMGKETWLMLSYVPDWRWLLDRNDSPWYPAAILYRQEKIGSWHGVLEKVKSDLEKLVN
jgi:hypothetical protein